MHIFGLLYSISIVSVLATMVPETPKWFYANRRYEEARESLQIIANRNGVNIDTSQIVFDTEIALQNDLGKGG